LAESKGRIVSRAGTRKSNHTEVKNTRERGERGLTEGVKKEETYIEKKATESHLKCKKSGKVVVLS